MAADGSRRRRRERPIPVVQGAIPGTLVPPADAPPAVVRVLAYGPEGHEEKRIEDPAELAAGKQQWPVVWVNVDGRPDARLLESLGELFHLHRLALEDVSQLHQRAKVEPYDEHLFVVARMVEGEDPLTTDQLSLFLGRGWLVTFQERPGDCFDPVRDRIREGRGRIRGLPADYLAYALLDAVVDGYFPAIERYGEKLDELESQVMARPRPEIARRIQNVRHDLLTLRRAAWPLRDALGALLRESGMGFMGDEARIYLRDCHDHAVQVLDFLETWRELCSGLMEMYLSAVSNRMNQVMKVLTIIATVFMPLSFISGIYGMNFDGAASSANMPELRWHYGYPYALSLMAAVAGVLTWAFWRAGWLSRDA